MQMHRRWMAAIGLGLLAVMSANAQTIGQQLPVEFEFKSDENKEEKFTFFSEYPGRLHLFYFWRPGNLESVLTMQDMDQISQQYGDRGLVCHSMVLSNEERMKEVLEEREIALTGPWADSRVYSPSKFLMESFGAYSHPYVVLVGPDRRIVWKGHPNDRLTERIDHLLDTEQPPAGDENRLRGWLRRAEKAFDGRHYGQAYGFAKRVREYTFDSDSLHAQADALATKAEAETRAWLDEAIQLEIDKEYEAAADVVAEIVTFMTDDDEKEKLDIVVAAESERARMGARREMKQQIDDAVKEFEALASTLDAEDWVQAGNYLRAREVYQELTDDEELEDTEHAKDAKKLLRQWKRDDEVQQRIAAQRAQREADRWLGLGEMYARSRIYDAARQQYEQVIATYPDSYAAGVAKRLIKELPEDSGKRASKD